MTTIVGVGLAVGYAFLLGLTFVVGSHSTLISLLDLHDQMGAGSAALVWRDA